MKTVTDLEVEGIIINLIQLRILRDNVKTKLCPLVNSDTNIMGQPISDWI